MEIPSDLAVGTSVFLIGSPHNHDPDDRPVEGDHKGSSRRFKLNIFHSMCWYTPTDSAVIMTFSHHACGQLEWWSVLQPYPTRIFMLAAARFERYRPRQGLASNMGTLSYPENIDTAVAIFVPADFMRELRWQGQFLNVAETIVAWMNGPTRGGLVSFGAYTAELELDIAHVSVCHETQVRGARNCLVG